MANNFSAHVRSDKVKWILVGLVIVVILAVLACLIAAAVSNTNVICLFAHEYDEKDICVRCGAKKPLTETQFTSGFVIDGTLNDSKIDGAKDDDNQVAFAILRREINAAEFEQYGVSEQAESAQVLTAALAPTGIVALVDWTANFENPNSEWATGKTVAEYVSLDAGKQPSSTCTVSCLQPFGESIIITASVRGQDNMQATCRCEYIKRIASLDIEVGLIRTEGQFHNNYNPYVVYSIGTVAPAVKIAVSSVELTQYGNNHLDTQDAEWYGDSYFQIDNKTVGVTNGEGYFTFNENEGPFWTFYDFNGHDDPNFVYENEQWLNDAIPHAEQVAKAYISNYKEEPWLNITFAVTASFNGQVCYSQTIQKQTYFDYEYYKVDVESISLSANSLYF